MSELRTKLRDAVPCYDMDDAVPKTELKSRGKGVEESAAAAHEALYQGYAEGNPRVTVFDDKDSELRGQYISFVDGNGDVCYGPWDESNPATDIGIRGANPDFEGVLNPTTVLHADLESLVDYQRRHAPQELLDALDALVLFNKFVIDKIAKPYLTQVAEAFGKDPDDYVAQFFPERRRARTLTRAILYHVDAPKGMRPVSKIDGAELLIKEHSDKSSFTIDTLQSSSGLQYFVDGVWRDARDDKIACFRGTADDCLNESGQGSLTPPTVHRAVVRETAPQEVSPILLKRGLARLALPTFISLSTAGARVVTPNSAETHPTGR